MTNEQEAGHTEWRRFPPRWARPREHGPSVLGQEDVRDLTRRDADGGEPGFHARGALQAREERHIREPADIRLMDGGWRSR